MRKNVINITADEIEADEWVEEGTRVISPEELKARFGDAYYQELMHRAHPKPSFIKKVSKAIVRFYAHMFSAIKLWSCRKIMNVALKRAFKNCKNVISLDDLINGRYDD
jgi:hypothetical protein